MKRKKNFKHKLCKGYPMKREKVIQIIPSLCKENELKVFSHIYQDKSKLYQASHPKNETTFKARLAKTTKPYPLDKVFYFSLKNKLLLFVNYILLHKVTLVSSY